MSSAISTLFWLLLRSCIVSGVDLETPSDSECHETSLLQVGLTVEKSTIEAPHRHYYPHHPDTPVVEGKSAIKTLLDTAAHSEGTVTQRIVSGSAPSQVRFRPGAEQGSPDTVTFGILIKKWYGIDFSGGTFSVDAVVTLQWSDPRTSKLLPEDAPSARMSTKRAKSQMWLPDIAVTNRAHDGDDVISSSVLITQDGNVTQVDRVSLTLKESYKTRRFPFDTQNVYIKLASTTYMREELQLVPSSDSEVWGVPEDLFENNNWDFRNATLSTIIDDDGALHKSRGVLTITVHRNPSQFIGIIFIPSIVLLCMTWSAFWLPLGGPYVMPRVAINAFALLCQLAVSQTAQGQIPATGKAAWMTEYLVLCVELQFVVMLVNVLLLAIEHRKGGSDLANVLNSRIIVAYPVSTAVNIAILSCGFYSTSRFLLVVTLVGYLTYLNWQYKYHHASPRGNQ